MSEPTRTLAEHKDWLYSIGASHIHECPCPFKWKGLGVLDRVSMGQGWVRMSTVASCPEHGTEALKAWRARYRASLA